jgi:predicted phosphodiesterase
MRSRPASGGGSAVQKTAILADIHGNLTALDAVLAAIDAEGIERVICLGDVATLGPQPHGVVVRLRALGCPIVMGNTDADLLALQRDADAQDGDRGPSRATVTSTAGAPRSSQTTISRLSARFSRRSAWRSATA